jgi:hypothetical protein
MSRLMVRLTGSILELFLFVDFMDERCFFKMHLDDQSILVAEVRHWI